MFVIKTSADVVAETLDDGPEWPHSFARYVTDGERERLSAAELARRSAARDVYHAARAAHIASVEKRAYDLGGLAYEVRGEEWHESVHTFFPCREIDEGHVEVLTPVGRCVLAARRARKGELVSEVAAGRGAYGFGRRATEDADSPPVRIHARLLPPHHASPWRLQVSSFEYEDGTCSGWLGCVVRDVEWPDGVPAW